MTTPRYLSHAELAQALATLIMDPEALGEASELDIHQRFVMDAASLLTDYCGGVIEGHHDDDLPSPALTQQDGSVAVGAGGAGGARISVGPDECCEGDEPGSWPDTGIWSVFGGGDGPGRAPALDRVQEVLSALARHDPTQESSIRASSAQATGDLF